jgi:hypothetical protein
MSSLMPTSFRIACVSSPSGRLAWRPLGITNRSSSVLPDFVRYVPLCFQPAWSRSCLAFAGLNWPTAPEFAGYSGDHSGLRCAFHCVS